MFKKKTFFNLIQSYVHLKEKERERAIPFKFII